MNALRAALADNPIPVHPVYNGGEDFTCPSVGIQSISDMLDQISELGESREYIKDCAGLQTLYSDGDTDGMQFIGKAIKAVWEAIVAVISWVGKQFKRFFDWLTGGSGGGKGAKGSSITISVWRNNGPPDIPIKLSAAYVRMEKIVLLAIAVKEDRDDKDSLNKLYAELRMSSPKAPSDSGDEKNWHANLLSNIDDLADAYDGITCPYVGEFADGTTLYNALSAEGATLGDVVPETEDMMYFPYDGLADSLRESVFKIIKEIDDLDESDYDEGVKLVKALRIALDDMYLSKDGTTPMVKEDHIDFRRISLGNNETYIRITTTSDMTLRVATTHGGRGKLTPKKSTEVTFDARFLSPPAVKEYKKTVDAALKKYEESHKLIRGMSVDKWARENQDAPTAKAKLSATNVAIKLYQGDMDNLKHEVKRAMVVAELAIKLIAGKMLYTKG